MFAAAAVAAAAALTAISTTQSPGVGTATNNLLTGQTQQAAPHHLPSSPNYKQLRPNSNNNISNNNQSGASSFFHAGSASLDAVSTTGSRPYISWKQYATQRRNSMQRRKIEITKRLERASSANQKKNYNIQQFQVTKQKSTDLNDSVNSRSFINDTSSKFRRQNTNDSQETGSNDIWLRQVSLKVCNEFIKMHQAGQAPIDDDFDLINHIDLTMHPTYKNFEVIAQLQNKMDDNNKFDLDKISQALYEYLRSLNITQESISLNQGVDNFLAESFDCGSSGQFFDDNESLNNMRRFNKENLLAQQAKKRKEDKLNYLLSHRWDPKWLKSMRTTFCIPFAILALIFLIFTNVNSNWIRFDKENQRAGLWTICNRTKLEDIYFTNVFLINGNESNADTTTSITITTSDTSTKLPTKLSNRILDGGIVKSFKRAKNLLIKTREVEDCYSKFFLEKDSHLAILCLALVSLLFHFIGTALLIIGFISSFSQRALYFYHSAGECLITSAIVHFIDLIAFVVVVSFQAGQSYKLGFCFYINTLISILTLACSIVLHLDDLVNEWKIWKIKAESVNVHKQQPDVFLSSI